MRVRRIDGDRGDVAARIVRTGVDPVPHHRRGGIGTFRVGDGYARSVCRQAFGDGSPDAARAARNQCNFSFEFSIHIYFLRFPM